MPPRKKVPDTTPATPPAEAKAEVSASAADATAPISWLMKAEPDERLVNGHDVSFSIHTFQKEGISSWEGVRNHEAKNILRDKIKLGHKMLLYHSNCKLPGVAGLGTCVKEGYADYNAWDPKHPYYDPKSKADSPTWFMVDVQFGSILPHFVPLKLLQTLATFTTPPDCVSYLSASDLSGIAKMALLNRGRLSVQPVQESVYEAIVKLGTRGGWDELLENKGATKKKVMTQQKEEEKEAGEPEGKKRKAVQPSRASRSAKKTKGS